jgi:hypothetical protein
MVSLYFTKVQKQICGTGLIIDIQMKRTETPPILCIIYHSNLKMDHGSKYKPKIIKLFKPGEKSMQSRIKQKYFTVMTPKA